MRPVQLRSRRLHRGVSRIAAPLLVAAAVPLAVMGSSVPASAFTAPSAVSDISPNSLSSGTLFGGRVQQFAVNPVNSNIVLAAIELGGVWRSTDAGAHWTHVDSLPLTATNDVKFAPGDASLVIATGAWDGATSASGGELYRSTDGGATWTRTTNPSCSLFPTRSKTMNRISFGAGSPGSIPIFVGGDCGVLKSTNSGQTWTELTPDPAVGQTFSDVKVRGTGPNFTVDTCGIEGFFRSTTGGTNWTATDTAGTNPIRGGAGGGYLPCWIDTSPTNANVVFLTSPIRTPSPVDGINETQIQESDNGGASGSWVNLTGSQDGNGRAPAVITKPAFDGNANHFELFYATDSRFLHQTCDYTNLPGTTACTPGNGNNGGSFTVYDNSIGAVHNAPDASDIAFDGTGCPFLEGGDGGVFSTTAGCGSFSPAFTQANVGLHGLQSSGMAGTVYAGYTDLFYGTQDNGLFNTHDTGTTWHNGGPDVYGVLADHNGPPSRVAWATCCGTGGGAVTGTINVANDDLSGAGTLNPPPGGVVAFSNIETQGAQFGNQRYALFAQPSPPSGPWQVYVTTNEGGTWTQMGPNLGGSPIQMVASGPPANPTFYLLLNNGGNKLYRLSGPLNGTATLTQVGTALNTPALISAKPDDPLRVWTVDIGDGTPANPTAIESSINGGASFTPDAALKNLVTGGGTYSLNAAGGSFVTALSLDANSNEVMVGTVDNGSYASNNGGASWAFLPGSGQISRPTNYFFDETRGAAYTSSAGRGIWKILLPHSDLSVTKTHTPEPAIAGQTLTWHITVKNNGPDAAPAVQFTDQLPPGDTYLADSLNPPGSCTPGAPGVAGQTVNCSLGDLNNGQSVSFDIQTLVAKGLVASAGGPTTLTDTATASSPTIIDTNPANDTATDTAIVDDSADLAVTKICKPDTTIQAGQPINCTVYVDNNGPSDARAVVLTDTIQSNPSVPITVTGFPGSCALAPITGGQKLTCALGTVTAATTTDPGRTTVSYSVSAADATDMNNLASVRSDTPDPNYSNNQSEVSLTVTATADVQIVATSTPASVTAGTDMTYVLTVTNNGPSPAHNVAVADTLPAGVTATSAALSNGGTCTLGIPGNPLAPTTCSIGNLATATPVTMTLVVHVLPDTTGTLANSARVSADTFDPQTANNLANGTTAVSASADLAATMVASPNPVLAGTTLTFRTNVTNNGPSVAAATQLGQDLPPGVSFTGYHLVGGGGSCALLTASHVGCSLGILGLGQTTQVFVDVVVAPSVPKATVLTSTATASSTATDPAPGNNGASASSTVDTSADLAIVNTSDAALYHPSTVIHYTITVTNTGPSDAQNVVVTDQLPVGKKIATYVSNNVGCPPPNASNLFTCLLGTIAAGGSKTFQLNVYITGNKGLITTTAKVTSTTFDPNLGNNTSVRNVTVK